MGNDETPSVTAKHDDKATFAALRQYLDDALSVLSQILQREDVKRDLTNARNAFNTIQAAKDLLVRVGPRLDGEHRRSDQFESLKAKNLADLSNLAKELAPAALRLSMQSREKLTKEGRREVLEGLDGDGFDGVGSLRAMALVVVGFAMWAE